jgi:hypothetical protein
MTYRKKECKVSAVTYTPLEKGFKELVFQSKRESLLLP